MNKWFRSNYLPCLPLGDHRSQVTGCERHIQLSRRAAAEGAVLLKNENNLLPFAKGTRVALFGKAQIDYIKVGGGSGYVFSAYTRNIYEGLQMKNGQVEIFHELSLYYEEYVKRHGVDHRTYVCYEEAPIPEELLQRAKEFTDTAIIVIHRHSVEGSDHHDGSTFYLYEEEKAMVDAVTANFPKVVVLLNVGAMIDTSWFANNDAISSAILLWQGGMEGGLAAADILTGDANPSGKLVDTCARTFEDYPSSADFHESVDYAKYTEDIYVGYRYFETVSGKKDCVVYPFGYGLSYTTFETSDVSVGAVGENIVVSLKVTNTGAVSGKEVVQVYYGAPVGLLGKPARQLCGFAKTRNLAPGETQSLLISFPIRDMASFDDMGVVERSCFVLEKGTYSVYVGTNVRNAQKVDYEYRLDENVIVEQLHSYCAPERLDKVMTADGTYRQIPCKKVERTAFPCTYRCAEAPEETYTLLDVADGKVDIDTFIAQITDEELTHFFGEQPNTGVSSTGGMGNLKRLGIPNVTTADGPAGVRLKPHTGIQTTAFPVASCLAATWNTELVEEVGRAGALEVKENNISIWLTPALNIHRSPLCGRNFEYYSEDPFVSGKMAAAMVRGIQSQNICATPKHFACNNKETNRRSSDSIVSERALREIYLKGFEICVKEAKPRLIMTAYNVLNGVRTSENAELIQGILRQEWGFDGMVTSDWDTLGEHTKEAKAGNDIKMRFGAPENLRESLVNGRITREELCECAKRILEMILWLN